MSVFDLDRIQRDTFVEHVEFHARLNSTSDLAAEILAHANLSLPLLVLAEEQTAGRGRGGNSWWSTGGAITMSLVIDINCVASSVDVLSFLSLMTGLAVCRVADERLNEPLAGIKWPNDVLINRRKLAGILVENPIVGSGRLVIGIGVNVNNSFAVAPTELQTIATSLFDLTGRSFDMTDCVISILRQIELVTQTARDDLLSEFASRDVLKGNRVSVDSGRQAVSGVCNGIDRSGALLLIDGDQMRPIRSGVIQSIDWLG